MKFLAAAVLAFLIPSIASAELRLSVTHGGREVTIVDNGPGDLDDRLNEITAIAFGGSASAGFFQYGPNALFPDQFADVDFQMQIQVKTYFRSDASATAWYVLDQLPEGDVRSAEMQLCGAGLGVINTSAGDISIDESGSPIKTGWTPWFGGQVESGDALQVTAIGKRTTGKAILNVYLAE